MKNVAVNGEMFVEDRQLREKYISDETIWAKLEFLGLLPKDEFLNVAMVADFFEVGLEAISSLIKDSRDELDSDGLVVIRGDNLKKFAESQKNFANVLSKKTRSMTILNRRCIMRCAMLLRKSTIAQNFRTSLLNLEEKATKEQRSDAMGRSWTTKQDMILYDTIVHEVLTKGNTLTGACEIASKKINKTPSACRNHYTSYLKKITENQDLIRRIENNKHGALKLVEDESNEVEDLLPETEWCRTPTREELFYNAVICMIEDIETHVKAQDNEINRNKDSEIERLSSENSRLKSKIKRVNMEKKKAEDELNQVRGLVASAIKVKVNEEISSVFSMDRNGNLERIS